MGGSLIMKAPAENLGLSGVTCATEVIVKMSPARSTRRTDYPCGCRYCRDLARAAREPKSSPLAAIDVYDLPDGAGDGPSDYFH